MRLASLVLLAAVAAASGVQADTASSPEAQAARKACRSDAMKLCSGKRGAEAAACLRASDKTSTACKDALAKLPPPTS